MSDERLQHVLRAEGIRSVEVPVLIESESNEVWRVGDLFVRICWRGDRRRLLREASVANQLPAEVGYPEIVAVAEDLDISWMVTRAVPGVPVQLVLDHLDSRARYAVGVRLGELIRLVHGVSVPEDLDERPGVDVVGEDVLPLPVPRARRLLQELSMLSHLDPSTVDGVTERLDDLEQFDPFVSPGVVLHGDAGISNLLWHRGEVVALIDFEWVRSGEPWVDVLGYTAYGDRHIAKGVRDAYPEPFEVDDDRARLRLLEIATALRTLALWPGTRNAERLRLLCGESASQ